MDASSTPNDSPTHAPAGARPEDVLAEMATGDDSMGARLLRLAREAASIDRISVLDLLMDDTESTPVAGAAEMAPPVEIAVRHDVQATIRPAGYRAEVA